MTHISDIYRDIEDSGILFNVREEPVFSKSGLQVLGRKAIIDEDSNSVVGEVSTSYKTVTNKQVVDAMLESLDRSKLDLDGAEVKITKSHYGARAMVDLHLPAHSVKLPGDSSESILQISTLNSYDGRWKYMSRGGAIRLACANGQIFGDFMGAYTSFHTARLSVDEGARKLVRMLETFQDAPQWWGQMLQTPVEFDEFVRIAGLFITGKTPKSREEIDKIVQRPTVAELVRLWSTYTKEFGTNAYAIYNALTDYVSNQKYNKQTHGAALLKNQEKLMKIVSKHEYFAKV